MGKNKTYKFSDEQIESIKAARKEDKLVEVIQDLKNTTVKSITYRDWILKCFNQVLV